MADIPATAAVSPTPAVTTSPGNNIVVETAVNNVPDKIAQLARQIEVSGTITQPPSGNAVTINTVIGQLVLILPQLAQAQQDKLIQQLINLFQNQKPLTVVLQPGNPPAQALLLLPPAGGSPQNTLNPALPGNILPNALPALQPNTVLEAIVLPNNISIPSAAPSLGGQSAYVNLNPNPGVAVAPDVTLNVSSGVPFLETLSASAVQDAIAKLDTGLASGPPSLQPLSPEGLSSSAPSASQGLPGLAPSSPADPSTLQPGTEISLRINAVFPPNAQNAPPAPQGDQILATVTGSSPGGQLILNAGGSTLFVRQPLNVPVGTQLLITVTPAQDVDDPAVLAPRAPLEFTNLQEIFAALAQADPALAQTVMAMRMPQPDESLPGALLFFLSAVRQGDVRGWLGNGAVDLLNRSGKAELIGKLLQDMQESTQTVHDSVVGEWKSYPVPLNTNNQFGIVHFYVHNERQRHNTPHGEKDEKPDSPSQIRFLIDVRMSRLGPLQLDGFLKSKHLDIIIRTETRLPPDLSQELRDTYAHAMESIGYNGGMNFQSGRQGWLTPQKPAAGTAVVT